MIFTIGLIWPAVIAAGAALAQGGLNVLSSKSAQKRSIDAQRSLQNLLMTGGAQQARTAKQAGLSPAFSLGSSSVPAASTPASPSGSFDFSNIGALLSNREIRKLQKQQERRENAATKTEEENAKIAEQKRKQEEIHTEQMKGENDAYNDYGTVYVDPDTKEVVPYDNKELYAKWLEEHPNSKVPIPLRPVGYKGQMQFDDWLYEYETKNSERSGRQREVVTQDIEREAREAHARYNKAIDEGRLNRRDVIESVIDMDKQKRNLLLKQIEQEGLLNVWQDLQNKQSRETSIGRMIDSLKDDSLSYGDKILVFLTTLANIFIGRSSVSFHR